MKDSTVFITNWLQDNFEYEADGHVAREWIYQEYNDVCERNRKEPLNSASFGKILRTVFSSVSTRRLGTRGNSKYLTISPAYFQLVISHILFAHLFV